MSRAPSGPPLPGGRNALLLALAVGALLGTASSAAGSPFAPSASTFHVPAGTLPLNTCPPPPASGGVSVTFDLSNPNDGSYVVSQASTTIVNVGKNITCTLPPASYDLNAFESGGSSFGSWQTNGEVQIVDATSSAVIVNITTGPVTITAQFLPPASPSVLSNDLVIGGLAGAILVAAIVAVLLLRRRATRASGRPSPRSTASSGSGSDTPSPTTAPPSGAPAWIERWPRYASSVVEGILEEDLWPAVAATATPASLLAFTWGRPERLTTKYQLSGAHVVRISRVEGPPGDERVMPTDVDRMADLLEKHLRSSEGQAVVLPDVHAMVNAAGAKNVIRFLEIGRDLALERKGSILFTLDPSAVTPADLALLERGAHKLVPSP